MIDHYLEAMYEREVRAEQDRGLVEALKRLPTEQLYKLASGQVKLASYGDGDVDDWLQKYKGTPLFEKAVALEKAKLELDATEQAQRQEREEVMKQLRDDTISEERDRLCLEKRVLDLELATAQAGGQGNADALEAQEGAGLEMAQQAHETEMAQQGKPPVPAAPAEAGPPEGGEKPKAPPKEEEKPEGEKPEGKGSTVTVKTSMAQKIAGVDAIARGMARQDFQKAAAALTQAHRDDLSKKEFALPGERKYPIHDERHASTALAYAKGKPEQSRVYAAVAKKYPALAARSSVPAVREDVSKEKKAGIGDVVSKGVQALKPFGASLASGARDVAGAVRAGGLKAGLSEARNVGGIIAQSHPLATAGAAGAAGLGAGMALSHKQQR